MKGILCALIVSVFVVNNAISGDTTRVWNNPVYASRYAAPLKTGKADPFFRVAVKVAPQVCWLGTTQDSMSTDGARAGFSYGLDMEFGITDNVWLGVGAYHSILGGNTRYSGRDSLGNIQSVALRSDFQFIEVPLFLKLKTDPISDRWTVWGRIGIAGAIKLGARTTEQQATNGVVTNELTYNSTAGFSLFRAYVPIGAGFDFLLFGRTTLYGGIQFDNGFTNIYKDNLGGLINKNTPVEEVARLKQFEFFVGILF